VVKLAVFEKSYDQNKNKSLKLW